jgi:hypothetical protein
MDDASKPDDTDGAAAGIFDMRVNEDEGSEGAITQIADSPLHSDEEYVTEEDNDGEAEGAASEGESDLPPLPSYHDWRVVYPELQVITFCF